MDGCGKGLQRTSDFVKGWEHHSIHRKSCHMPNASLGTKRPQHSRSCRVRLSRSCLGCHPKLNSRIQQCISTGNRTDAEYNPQFLKLCCKFLREHGTLSLNTRKRCCSTVFIIERQHPQPQKGGPCHKELSDRTLPWTGCILMVRVCLVGRGCTSAFHTCCYLHNVS